MNKIRTNDMFGYWKVVRCFRSNSISYVECLCTGCKNLTISSVRRSNLVSGKSMSCGCQSKQLQYKSIIRNKKVSTKTRALTKDSIWGYLTILEEHIEGGYLQAQCSCGITKKFIKSKVLSGASKSCGCKHHLDHIFSIAKGFKQKISPHIIASQVNLQMLPKSANTKKGDRCWITEKELHKRYQDFIGNQKGEDNG
jgi:hypothetical protein